MTTHPDANAFMRGYLRKPTDVTTRLVFADWLDETWEPANVAWARYIRLKAEADSWPPRSPEQRRLEREATEVVPEVQANLTIPASLFVGYPKSLLQLLPAENFTVKLDEFEPSRPVLELMPESVARENLVLPLDLQESVLFIAATDPHHYDTIQKIQFILNKNVVAVRADAKDIQEAINKHYGQTEVETVDSVLIDFPDVLTYPGASVSPALDQVFDAPVIRVVNLTIIEAIHLHADTVQLIPTPDAITTRYRIRGEWIEGRDWIPARLGQAITLRLAIMGGIDVATILDERVPLFTEAMGEFPFQFQSARYSIQVAIRPATGGHDIDLNITEQLPVST